MTGPGSPYRAVYINLDRSEDRRARMTRALKALPADLPVSRFSAVEVDSGRGQLTAGELGCCLSNLAVLEAAGDDQHLLVFEDDVVFSHDVAAGLNAALPHLEAGATDILFLGQTIQFEDIPMHRRLITAWNELDQSGRFVALKAEKSYRWGTFAYAVAKRSTRKLAALLRTGLDAENPMPLDQYYRNRIQAGALRATVLFPYVAGVDPAQDSTMTERGFSAENDLHFQLVNLYMRGGASESEVGAWNDLLSQSPNLQALAVARVIYRRLVTRGRRPKSGQD